MSKPTLCVIHEAVSQDSAIARIALMHVHTALAAGWDVSVVAKLLDPSLKDQIHWLPLQVPSRGFFFQWTSARHFIRSALGDRQFDVIHAHQPQVADLSDVFTCHFLTRVAYERKCLETRRGLRQRLIRLQQQGVLHAEDRCWRRWNPATHMLFISAMMRDEFARLYGMPPVQEVLLNPCPPMRDVRDSARRDARTTLVGDFAGLVVGYLGGLHERKGYKRLITAIEGDESLFLLMAGPHSDQASIPSLKGRFRALGQLDEVRKEISTFYAACDVLVVPSLFEPLGMVALEAASYGVPVIATSEVGALPHLLEFGAGACWKPGESLGGVARDLIANLTAIRDGAKRMTEELSYRRHGERLLAIYDRALGNKPASQAASARALHDKCNADG